MTKRHLQPEPGWFTGKTKSMNMDDKFTVRDKLEYLLSELTSLVNEIDDLVNQNEELKEDWEQYIENLE